MPMKNSRSRSRRRMTSNRGTRSSACRTRLNPVKFAVRTSRFRFITLTFEACIKLILQPNTSTFRFALPAKSASAKTSSPNIVWSASSKDLLSKTTPSKSKSKRCKRTRSNSYQHEYYFQFRPMRRLPSHQRTRDSQESDFFPMLPALMKKSVQTLI